MPMRLMCFARRPSPGVAKTCISLGSSASTPLDPALRSADRYSHSIVAGGFDEMSYTTRFTPGTSLTIRLLIFARTS